MRRLVQLDEEAYDECISYLKSVEDTFQDGDIGFKKATKQELIDVIRRLYVGNQGALRILEREEDEYEED